MTWRDCDECTIHLFENGARGWRLLRGACASVGIKRGKRTDEMFDHFMAHHHRDHQETTPCP